MFGRKKKTRSIDAAAVSDAAVAADSHDADKAALALKSAPADRAVAGPYDVTEVPQIRPYIDLGAIKVAPREGMQVRLDIEQQSKRIIAVSIDYEGSTMQAQAFSAPKSKGIWHTTRAEMANQLVAQQAQVQEQEGAFGPELVITPAAESGAPVVRCFGVDGPRWLLRAIVVGPAATDPAHAKGLESIFREMIVVRGQAPMPPGEVLLLQMPDGGVADVAGEQQTLPERS